MHACMYYISIWSSCCFVHVFFSPPCLSFQRRGLSFSSAWSVCMDGWMGSIGVVLSGLPTGICLLLRVTVMYCYYCCWWELTGVSLALYRTIRFDPPDNHQEILKKEGRRSREMTCLTHQPLNHHTMAYILRTIYTSKYIILLYYI